jgi:hypothetical protein
LARPLKFKWVVRAADSRALATRRAEQQDFAGAFQGRGNQLDRLDFSRCLTNF